MSFLKKLFGGGGTSSGAFYNFSVVCDRCGETIEGRVNLSNDLSLDDEGGYFVRKVLVGSERCFQRIEARFKFDASRQFLDKQVSGGKFLD